MALAGTLTLIVATITTGWIAGLFYAFSCSVMIALRTAGERTFIDVMQRINAAILNGWFFLGFVGALVSTGLAVVLEFFSADASAMVPSVAAFVLYVGMIGVTRGVNIPLNLELDAAGNPERLADPGAVRRNFEARWVRWNLVRTVLTTASLGCLCWALAVH